MGQTRFQQLCAAVGSTGSFTAGTIAAAYAKVPIYDPKINFSPGIETRKPASEFLTSPLNPAGKFYATLTFKTPIQGSGTPGTAPAHGVLLKGCGFKETLSGAASNTTPVAYADNDGSSAVPTIAGSYNGSGRAKCILTITAKAATITMDALFKNDAGGDSFTAATLTDDSAQSIGLGLTVAANPDFSTFLAACELGDRWEFYCYEDAQVDYDLEEPLSGLAVPVLDLALIQQMGSGGGRVWKLRDCRGTVNINCDTVGQSGYYEFEFTGIPGADPPSALQALLSSIEYEDIVPPSFKAITTSLYSATPQCYTNVNMDIGNTVSPCEDAQSSFGYNTTYIVDRDITGSINPLGALVATAEWSAKVYDQTAGALSWTLGSASGNTVAFSAPKVQVTELSIDDRDGMLADVLTFSVKRPTYDAGGDYDPLTITYT